MIIYTKDKKLKRRLEKAVKLAKAKHIGTIVVFDAGSNVSFIDPNSGLYCIQVNLINDCSDVFLASLMVHEDQHCIDFYNGFSEKESEREARLRQIDFLKENGGTEQEIAYVKRSLRRYN